MGSVAKLIKQAAFLDERVSKEEYAKQLEGIKSKIKGLPETASGDITRMAAPIERGGFDLPTSSEETMRRALCWLAILGGTGLTVGAAMRLARATGEGARRKKLVKEFTEYAGPSTREVHVPVGIPKRASIAGTVAGMAIPATAVGAVAAPSIVRSGVEGAGKAYEAVKDIGSRMWEPSGRATDAPLMLPAAVLGSIAAAYLGYHGTGAVIDALREKRMKRQISRAKKEFEQALAEQYRQSELAEAAGVKAGAVLPSMLDIVARAHVSGELAEQIATLNKQAADEDPTADRPWWQGSLRTSSGAYLALLALLGTVAFGGGYHFSKSREEKRKKFEVSRELLRRRGLAEPPYVTVEPVRRYASARPVDEV